MADLTLISLAVYHALNKGRVEAEAHTPLGPLYLVSALERTGIEVDFRDYQVTLGPGTGGPLDLVKFNSFAQGSARIVGLSCMANLLPLALLAAAELKRDNPERVVIIGGVGPFGVEEKILENFPAVDFIGHGEGELSLPRLIKALLAGESPRRVGGFFFRDRGRVIFTGLQERVANLDDLAWPAYHRLCPDQDRAYGLMSSRGCPYGCTFCSVAPVWGRRPAFRSVDDILAEMAYLEREQGAKQVLFQDEFFISTPDRLEEFLNGYHRLGLGLRWRCFGRINLMTPEMFDRMARANCVQVRFGVESGSNRVLARIRKGFTYDQARRVIGQAVKIIESVEAFFIWGFPFETWPDFYRTAAAMVQLTEAGVSVLPSLLSPLPQTDIYRDYQAGRYKARLEFCPEIMPVYVNAGDTELDGPWTIPPRTRAFYEFIQAHREIFPGFFVFDPETNVRPKYDYLRRLGIY